MATLKVCVYYKISLINIQVVGWLVTFEQLSLWWIKMHDQSTEDLYLDSSSITSDHKVAHSKSSFYNCNQFSFICCDC